MVKKLKILIGVLIIVLASGCQEDTKVDSRIIQSAEKDICPLFSRLTGDYWQIWSISSDGTDMKQLTDSIGDKRYPCTASDNADLVYYVTTDSRLVRFNTKDGSFKEVLKQDGLNLGVCVSPDSRLLFSRLILLDDLTSIWVGDLNGSGRFIKEKGTQMFPTWMPDGEHIIYTSGIKFYGQSLCMINSNGSNKKVLLEDNYHKMTPSVSPNGKYIAYSSNKSGNYDIWLFDMDSNKETQLTTSLAYDTSPGWSADSKSIIFSSNRNSSLQLWKMNKSGKGLKQLTFGQSSTDPFWSN